MCQGEMYNNTRVKVNRKNVHFATFLEAVIHLVYLFRDEWHFNSSVIHISNCYTDYFYSVLTIYVVIIVEHLNSNLKSRLIHNKYQLNQMSEIVILFVYSICMYMYMCVCK